MEVLIHYLPFGIVHSPHLGAGLLKACLRQAGHGCTVGNLALEFARHIGPDEYSFLQGWASPVLLGERIFAGLLNDQIPDWEVFFREIIRPAMRGVDNALVLNRAVYLGHIRRMRAVEAKAKAWLEEVAARDLGRYGLLGFSTCYEQNAASLALARRLRARYPGKPIVFGGANCMAEMGIGLLKAFDFIDYVCIGEGERCLVDLAGWLEDPERNAFPERGIVSRRWLEGGSGVRAADVEPDMVPRLDDLPAPDYSDYFDLLRKGEGWQRHFYSIPMEGSRGCWKGQRRQCLFCGLNGPRNLFRGKSPERFVQELSELCARYQVHYVMVSDNVINPALLEGAFPRLRSSRPYRAMWQEITVGATRSQLEVLRSAGVRYLGAGLESLSTRLLEIMRKGGTLLDNLHFLVMTSELGIDVIWHIIAGIPGETQADYEAMAAVMPKLYHLPPPKQLIRISIDRHSPLYREAGRWGMQLDPSRAYRYIYALPEAAIAEFAYCFQDRNQHGGRMCPIGPPACSRSAQAAIAAWKSESRRSKLDFVAQDGQLIVRDRRGGCGRTDCYGGIAKAILLAAREPCRWEDLERAARQAGLGSGPPDLEQAIEELMQRGYLVEDGGRFLFLGLDSVAREKNLADKNDNFFLRAVQEERAYTYDGV
ncbi:MAG TPA: RiPP maturation radical SAM C-methyltransferase [Candidatus Paceibacterota bacterium]|nr:RiPP maturation radical SAM C-methyltransferase [Verrucomicrobiota bacterium]HOX01452.1 RiPP maturation radical SAM C-methyltransferase [Verrucomicrobiota bacterium]HRZ44425.1 RiPP maturation radical SAM C-methyltransferase [Candidatus Paceibacterota bacterium]